MHRPVRVFIGIGSNLNHPSTQVLRAIETLKTFPPCQYVKHAELLNTKPLGDRSQPDYVNTVVEMLTHLSPQQLLDELLTIEARQGRVRSNNKWASRIIDLDLLLYGDECIQSPALVLPHPGIRQRGFVICSLYELAPDLVIPTVGSIQSLFKTANFEGIMPLAMPLSIGSAD